MYLRGRVNQLERELAEATVREKAEAAARHEYGVMIERLERQLAEAQNRSDGPWVRQEDYLYEKALWRNAKQVVEDQRDRLAEALLNSLRFVRAYHSMSVSAMDDMRATEKQADAALAAVKGEP